MKKTKEALMKKEFLKQYKEGRKLMQYGKIYTEEYCCLVERAKELNDKVQYQSWRLNPFQTIVSIYVLRELELIQLALNGQDKELQIAYNKGLAIAEKALQYADDNGLCHRCGSKTENKSLCIRCNRKIQKVLNKYSSAQDPAKKGDK